MAVDRTAIIDPDADVRGRVQIGAHARIGPGVTIEDGSSIGPHVVIHGPTHIGPDNRIHQFTIVGAASATDTASAGVQIGRGNVIREFCTIDPGNGDNQGAVRIGDRNYIMAYVRIEAGAALEHEVMVTNGAIVGAGAEVASHAYLGPFSTLGANRRFGEYSFTAIASGIETHVPPYVIVSGRPAKPRSLNMVGLRRHGFSPQALDALRRAFKIAYRERLTASEAAAAIRQRLALTPELEHFAGCLEASDR